MKSFVLVCFAIIAFAFNSHGQATIEWDETYGGEMNDGANRILQLKDGGILIIGYTESEGSGKRDGYAFKLNAAGEKQWEMTYGGDKNDELFDAIEYGVNEYLFAGYTSSKGAGDDDYWLIHVDSEGKELWDTTYGGKDSDRANKILKSFDGNILLFGESQTFSAGARDIWVISVNIEGVGKAHGKIAWKKNIGGDKNDYPNNVRWKATDSLFYTIGNSVTFSNGGADAWLLGISNDRGNAKMKRNYGYKNFEDASDFMFTEDDYAIITGSTLSKGAGLKDGWILKLADGYDEEWEKFYGGYADDEFVNIFVTERGYLVVGNTNSQGEGKFDIWIMQVDKKGEQLWESTLGDIKDDKMTHSIIDKDGNLIICGTTFSKGSGAQDIWVLKVKVKK